MHPKPTRGLVSLLVFRFQCSYTNPELSIKLARSDVLNSDNTQSRRSFLKGAAMAGAAAAVGGLPTMADDKPIQPICRTFSVMQFGAAGDGVADDTKAAQAAIDAAVKAKGGHVYFPSGQYRITRSLVFSSADRFDVTGDGRSSVLLHENDEPLLLWSEKCSLRECTIANLSLLSVKNDKSPSTPAILCRGGAERSAFIHLFLASSGAKMGSGIIVEEVMDTTTLDNCVMWSIGGTGVKTARGSEVRIIGGRITGSSSGKGPLDGTIGVHIAGKNGGVHIVTTDIIHLHTGLQIGDPGGPSNREIFITHASFDSNVHGIHQVDHAYTSIAGCWAASSDEEQILMDTDAHGAIMTISGGTIFNGGASKRPGSGNGMVVKAGSFMLTGVTVRNNNGVGLYVGDGVSDYTVTGCRFIGNGSAAELRGDSYAFTGNVFARNTKALSDFGGSNKVVQGNAGC